jgi:hypothetical protein
MTMACLQEGPLDTEQAKKLGIKKLPTIVWLLRKKGAVINTTWVDLNVAGRIYKVGQYRLAGAPAGGKKPHPTYRRGKKATAKAGPRKMTCEVGETVMHQGRKVMVTEILEPGVEGTAKRSYIAACALHHADGLPLRRVLVPCGVDWKRA